MIAPDSSLSRWARGWQTAGEFLQRERAEHLRNMSDDDARAAIAALFFGVVPQPPAEDRECGLIEQQRLFRKLRRASPSPLGEGRGEGPTSSASPPPPARS